MLKPTLPTVASLPGRWCAEHNIIPKSIKMLSDKIVVVFLPPNKNDLLPWALFAVQQAGVIIYRHWIALPRRLKRVCEKAEISQLLVCQ
jgi:hypothetical protein